jgi:hypothetical protein
MARISLPARDSSPSTVWPGSSSAITAARLAIVPRYGCTLACSAPNTSFARRIASSSIASA